MQKNDLPGTALLTHPRLHFLFPSLKPREVSSCRRFLRLLQATTARSACPRGPRRPHQPVALLEDVAGEDAAGGVHHRLLQDVVVAGGRGGVQWHLGNQAGVHRWTRKSQPGRAPRGPLPKPAPTTGHGTHRPRSAPRPRPTFWVSAHRGLTFQEFPKSTGSSSTWRLLLVRSLFWMPSKFPHRPHTCSWGTSWEHKLCKPQSKL